MSDPAGSGYKVTTQTNITSYQARIAIEQFLADAMPQDLHLIYFSGHGIQDARGDLYFAFSDTRHEWPGSTAVSADWVRTRMNASRSRSTVVLIDCCFSGAFLRGMRSRASADANVASLVRDLPEGSGIAILTASGETEFSLEDSNDQPGWPVRPSYFTEAVVTGISTGAADHDRDGRITVDELYDYVYRRVRSGPSPQRPKKMGFGEGHVVVALAARHSPEPPPPALSSVQLQTPADPAKKQPTTANSRASSRTSGPTDKVHWTKHPRVESDHRPVTLPTSAAVVAFDNQPILPVEARGLLGTVTFDGEWITLTKASFGPRMKGSIRLHVSQVLAVTVRPATHLFHGYIQFVVRGHPTTPVAPSGLAAGRPRPTDPFSMSFARKANDAVASLHERVEEALNPSAPQPQQMPNAVHPDENGPQPRNRDDSTAPSANPQTTTSSRLYRQLADATGGTPRAETSETTAAPTSAVPLSPNVTAHFATAVQARAETRLTDRRSGHNDGTVAAKDIPLYAFEGLLATNFDVSRWLKPWREAWRLVVTGKAPPDANLLRWLPPLAQFLGSYAAPAELFQATITPSSDYIAGFVDGLSETWRTAVEDRLLAPNAALLGAWLREPAAVQPSEKPRALVTIGDLLRSARRTRRVKAWMLTGRITLWILTVFFAVMEMAAIGVTVTGGWKPNTVVNAVIGNICFATPLGGLATLGYFDIRRHRTLRRASTPAESVARPANKPPQ